MNTFQHAKFEVGLYLAISKITWTLRGLVLKSSPFSNLSTTWFSYSSIQHIYQILDAPIMEAILCQ